MSPCQVRVYLNDRGPTSGRARFVLVSQGPSTSELTLQSCASDFALLSHPRVFQIGCKYLRDVEQAEHRQAQVELEGNKPIYEPFVAVDETWSEAIRRTSQDGTLYC